MPMLTACEIPRDTETRERGRWVAKFTSVSVTGRERERGGGAKFTSISVTDEAPISLFL